MDSRVGTVRRSHPQEGPDARGLRAQERDNGARHPCRTPARSSSCPTTSTTTHRHYTGPLHPVDTDKSPIEWDGNVATLAGILHEIERFYKRKNLFQMLFKHHAVALHSGKLAVDSVDGISVIFSLNRCDFFPNVFYIHSYTSTCIYVDCITSASVCIRLGMHSITFIVPASIRIPFVCILSHAPVFFGDYIPLYSRCIHCLR